MVVGKGELVALLGPNGAGKTTTIEILEGFRLRSGGAASVFGVDPSLADETWRSRTGVVLQSWRDHPRWTPRQLIDDLGRYYEPYSTPERPRPWPTDHLIGVVGLDEYADQKIRTLSGGQRRRLDVAIGIVGRPELLFLDEPTAGFDPKARRDFHELVQRLVRDEDTTVLLTTHDLDEAEKLADRILIIADGRIVANGTAGELARQTEGQAQVRWRTKGREHVQMTSDPTGLTQLLLAGEEEITDLEVRRPSLEDVYLKMVGALETDQRSDGSFDSADTREILI